MMPGEKDLQNLLSIYAVLWDNKKRNMRETVQGEENSNYETKNNDDMDNENSGERHTDFSHPNAVYLYRDEQSEDKKLRRRKMYNDTWDLVLEDHLVAQDAESVCEPFGNEKLPVVVFGKLDRHVFPESL